MTDLLILARLRTQCYWLDLQTWVIRRRNARLRRENDRLARELLARLGQS